MAEVGSAFVTLMPSARGFGRATERQISPELDQSGKKSGKRLGTGIKVGALAVLGAATVGAKFLGDAIGEARESQKVTALTASVIRATGGAANVTAGQVARLSTALSNKTGIDDEVIQSGQNMLLTFKNVRNEAGKGNDIFNQASATLVDLSAAMGTEPKQAAIQLGKALNDPVKGISALTRVGVTFTEKQKNTIKSLVASGDAMGAQRIILRELNSEFGGAAAAQATSADKARVALGNLKETIGTALLPVVDRLANFFTTRVAPAITTFITGMQNGTGAGGAFARILSNVGSAVGVVAGFIGGQLIPFVRDLGARFTSAMGGTAGFRSTLASLAPVARLAMAVLRVLWSGIQIAGRVMIPQAAVGIRFLARVLGTLAGAAIGLWNHAFRPTFQFILRGISGIIGAFAKVVGAIAKIPGPQQAAMRKVASALDGASRHVETLSGKLKNIPDGKAKVSVDTSAARAEVDGFIRTMSGRTIRIGTHIGGMAGARAAGGPIAARQTYLVGEKGPELFTSRQAGTITPNHKLNSGSGSPVIASGVPRSVILRVGDRDMQAWFEESYDGERAFIR